MKDYMLPVILTREFDLGVAVTRLIAGGVVERYPDLQFVFAHFGGGLAGYKERISRSSYRFKLPKSFDDYFNQLYFDMAGFEGSPIALRCALEVIKPERMLFATDYPQNFNAAIPNKARASTALASISQTFAGLPLDAQPKKICWVEQRRDCEDLARPRAEHERGGLSCCESRAHRKKPRRKKCGRF